MNTVQTRAALNEAFTQIEGASICVTEGLCRAFERLAQKRLIGPRDWITSGSRETITHSEFFRVSSREVWQWAAWSGGQIIQVIEMPFVCPDVCDTEQGALWALRGIVAHYMQPDCRAYRN